MAIHFDTQGPAPNGFHVPTKDEWTAVCNTGASLGAWTYNNPDNLIYYLKLPLAGYRDYRNASASYQGSYGFYWSSSRYDENNAYSLSIGLGSPSLQPQNSGYRSLGYPIRCFKDTPVTPDNTRTQIYDGGDGPQGELTGIYHNATLGLISISSDGTNRTTIQDKNLGATTVWNNGDTLSETNCGYYYQRGNNYGFPFTGDVTTSGSQVDASGYGPGNYYSSSTFITGNQRWDTTDNGNLRGGVTNGTWGYPDMKLHGAIQTFHWKKPDVPTMPTSGLLAYRPLESDVKDHKADLGVSGTAYDGTINGTGSYGTAGDYTGIYFNRNGYISTTLNYNSLPVTFCVWAYDTRASGWEVIMSNNISNDNKGCFAFRKSDNRITPVDGTGETQISGYGDGNSWYCYCFTVENGTSKLYVNGSLVQTINSGASGSYGSYWTFGRWNNANEWQGYLRQGAVYNRALSADEILEYYNGTK